MIYQKYAKYFLLITTCILLVLAMIFTYSLKQPLIPTYVVVWGFIGSATYVAKTVASYIGTGKFDDKYIPYHFARLIIGPALAVIVYFIVKSESVFGLTLAVTADKEFYIFSVLSFMSGYFVRHVIDMISEILNTVLKLPKNN